MAVVMRSHIGVNWLFGNQVGVMDWPGEVLVGKKIST